MMDKCCATAIRISTGIIALCGSAISFLLAYDTYNSGTSLSAWKGLAGNDKVLYIKLLILGGLALAYGITSILHRGSRLGALIPSLIGLLAMSVSAVSLNELLAFFFASAVLTVLSIASFFEREKTVVRWEKVPSVSASDFYF
ncbi:hypothetical protein SAMN02910447_01584 [Ruminococcus sp. YE71]|uniref:hypothetical protein n=1 Tax=unclassified Ruminococcus TaxID=2608920 RepID=UPI00088A7AC3|nr:MULTISPECIES: hypothetical protein [unclassified Ruminococcus]SDA18206.1 hypothetical protein SAMN02910446_01388 [Ruminococcus sp. YE78]SFW30295.1 hypothetical protein SAMN02910447_01584 [Ruminococcus sp. YE71]